MLCSGRYSNLYLSSCVIALICTISLANCMQIFIQTPVGKKINIDVNIGDSVGQLKVALEGKLGLAASELRLLYAGKELENEHSLDSYRLAKESVIYLIAPQRIKVRVRTGAAGDMQAIVEIDPRKTIREFKEALEIEFGELADDITLHFANRKLDDELTLENCGIGKQSVVYMRTLDFETRSTLLVKTFYGTKFEVRVRPTSSVSSVKRLIQAQEAIPAASQQLTIGCSTLEDGKLLKDYHFVNETIAFIRTKEFVADQLEHDHETGLQIRVLNGETFELSAKQSDTIASIKAKIELKVGIERARQTLVASGHILADARTLNQCAILSDSLLYLVVRHRGFLDEYESFGLKNLS